MNDLQLENNIRGDVSQVTYDLGYLAGDSAVQLSRYTGSLGHVTMKAKDEVVSWIDDGLAQMSAEVEKLTGEARDSMHKTADAVKQDVGQGLSQYNQQVGNAAKKVSGALADHASHYPWVMISFALVIGFVSGLLLPRLRAASRQN